MAAVIRNRFGGTPEPVPCGFAAACTDGERVAILLPAKSEDDGADVRDFGLGSVLIWGRGQTLPIVVVAPEDRAGGLARQAEAFDPLSVWVIEDNTIVAASPSELPAIPPLGDLARQWAPSFRDVGAVPVDDFGRLVAEVEGLEIARAEAQTGELSIGVGTADRELHGYVHTNQESAVSLQKAADTVRFIRRQGSAGHPLNRRGRQRWLRAAAHQNPALVGAASLEMVPPLEERFLQLGPEPCAAIEQATDTIFVFSAGIDPEVVPFATDYRRRHQPNRTVIVTTPADVFPATLQIAAAAGIDTTTTEPPF